MEGIMAEHHQQYMRNNPLRLFPDGSEMDPSSAAAAAAMLTEKARSALGLPPSAFWPAGNGHQQHPAQQHHHQQAPQQPQRPRNPMESSFQPFMTPSAAAATAAAMSQLYSRGAAGMIPPPHFWSQFYGLNHQLGLLTGLAGAGFPNAIPNGPDSSCGGSPPSPSTSTSPIGYSNQHQHQRFSPYPLTAVKSQLRTPSPRNVALTVPSSSPK